MEQRDFGFSDCSFNFNHPQSSSQPTSGILAESDDFFLNLGHLNSTQRNRHISKRIHGRMCAFSGANLFCSEGDRRQKILTISEFHVVTEYSSSVFVSDIFHLSVCMCLACRASGMCRFQKNSSSIFI